MAWAAFILLDNIFLKRLPFPQLSLIYKPNSKNHINLSLSYSEIGISPTGTNNKLKYSISLKNKVFKTQYSETFQYLMNLLKNAHYQEWETTTTVNGRGKTLE